MSRHIGPRTDSAAHKVICRLVDLGGKATRENLMLFLGADLGADNSRVRRFIMSVVRPLEKYGYVIADQTLLAATPAGKHYVAAFIAPPVEKYVGKIATVRVAPPERPLNFAKHCRVALHREGSMDHRNIPSLMGGRRVLPGQGVTATDD